MTWVGTVLEACSVGREGLPSWACYRGRTLDRTWQGGTWAVEGCLRPWTLAVAAALGNAEKIKYR